MDRFMRVMVFFDLPTATKAERKQYTKFRHFLIESGFAMVQYSVYSRTARNSDDANKYNRMVRGNLPPEGSVRTMIVTEKQYAAMEIMLGEKTMEEKLLDSNDIIEL